MEDGREDKHRMEVWLEGAWVEDGGECVGVERRMDGGWVEDGWEDRQRMVEGVWRLGGGWVEDVVRMGGVRISGGRDEDGWRMCRGLVENGAEDGMRMGGGW